MSVMDIPSMEHATISFILHYSENTGKQNNECMLHPFLVNYIHPFKIMYNQNIDNSECFGVKFVKIYPEKIWFWLII
jgi:hypothetical protein